MGDSCCRGTGTTVGDTVFTSTFFNFSLYRNHSFDVLHSRIDRFLDLYEFTFQLVTMSLCNDLLRAVHPKEFPVDVVASTLSFQDSSSNDCIRPTVVELLLLLLFALVVA